MSKPDIAILTICAELSAELQSCLKPNCDVTVHARLNEFDESLNAREPAYLIIDFRDASGGGHEEDRVLSHWESERPSLPVIVLADAACPETLERRTACNESVRLVRENDPTKIVSQLVELIVGDLDLKTVIDDCPEQNFAIPKPAKGLGAETVLTGLNRKFETNSASMKEMLLDLEIAASHDVTVLLIGETGSGKTYLSRLIHEMSPRRDQPLITVACGALPGELIESELFGHAKGAFTSAHAEKEGKFVEAKGGTILLDEIDVLTPEQQVKLLRVIETGEFEPVGSNETIKCQARLFVTSNLALQPLVEAGKFRADLYYRLNMLKFDIVPLRSRREDITPLAHKFVTQLSEMHGVTIDVVDRSFYVALNAYPWPGNVRELENVVQRAVIYARDGKLTSEHLPRYILTVQAGPTNDTSVVIYSNGLFVKESGNQKQETLSGKIENTEREIIQQTLLENSFNRTKTARELGVSRVTLYNKMKKYGIA